MKTESAALITIDFINDIVHADGKIPSCAVMIKERAVLAHTNRAMAWAHTQTMPVVHIKVGFSAGYANHPIGSPVFGGAKQLEALKLGDWGTDFHEQLSVTAEDFIVIKPRVSIFYGTPLESLLRAQHIQHLFLCGVSTNMAVEAAAREAHDRDYRVTVLADCCAAANPQFHEQALTGTLSRAGRYS